MGPNLSKTQLTTLGQIARANKATPKHFNKRTLRGLERRGLVVVVNLKVPSTDMIDAYYGFRLELRVELTTSGVAALAPRPC